MSHTQAQLLQRLAKPTDQAPSRDGSPHLSHALATACDLHGDEHVVCLHGLAAVRAAYNDIQLRATKSIDAFDCCPHSPETIGQSETQSKALDAGVSYRVVYSPEVFAEDSLLSTMLLSVRQGENARLSRLVPAHLLIRDDEEFMLLHPASKGREISAVLGATPWTLRFLRCTFEAIWQAAMPLSLERIKAWNLLNNDERQIITLLAAGLTDESAARQLGISVRTVQRKVQAIQRSVGANSRFQLGALTAAFAK
ncbi:MAG: helix-turn-helix transcriptional regulator [Propionibacteriaceae bacterium]|nr:helix-turn-helix transcriptional regulator [Propionibacteriaceae bacterium]